MYIRIYLWTGRDIHRKNLVAAISQMANWLNLTQEDFISHTSQDSKSFSVLDFLL